MWDDLIMNEPRIRRAGRADALLVAALTIQAARAQGLTPEPGFMDRHAEAWLDQFDQHPTWWVEFEGQHAGLLVAIRSCPLPWPGRETAGVLRVERVFVRPDLAGRGLEESLKVASQIWAAERRLEWVDRAG